ncbi:hypothetical protein J2S55_003170 [Streptosporangium brasiliense]|uniref:Uncharacterized protein n=1 Tax=Streptosporangium brasiliense TaxID=47480 RepID=A0ABT9R3V3_9ACTN|nr:hypothetical protein [Streptosporangium brasiliense]
MNGAIGRIAAAVVEHQTNRLGPGPGLYMLGMRHNLSKKFQAGGVHQSRDGSKFLCRRRGYAWVRSSALRGDHNPSPISWAPRQTPGWTLTDVFHPFHRPSPWTRGRPRPSRRGRVHGGTIPARGWSGVAYLLDLNGFVGPAPAGMIPGLATPSRSASPRPRACGDGPYAPRGGRMSGSLTLHPGMVSMTGPRPAVSRCSRDQGPRVRRPSHARGGEPRSGRRRSTQIWVCGSSITRETEKSWSPVVVTRTS